MLIISMGAKALRSAKGKRGFWVAEWDCRVVRASLLAMTFSFFLILVRQKVTEVPSDFPIHKNVVIGNHSFWVPDTMMP